MNIITERQLNLTHPRLKPYYLRDNKVTGFAVKVNPSESMKFIAEVRHEEKTLGSRPIMPLAEARNEAILYIYKGSNKV